MPVVQKEVQQRVTQNLQKQTARQKSSRTRRNMCKDRHSKAGKQARAQGGGTSLF